MAAGLTFLLGERTDTPLLELIQKEPGCLDFSRIFFLVLK
jgi:hypothetical protein